MPIGHIGGRLSIIAFIVMFCWYMHTVGVSKQALKVIGKDTWWGMFLVFPATYTYHFMKGFVISVGHGMKLAIQPVDKDNNKIGEGK